MGLDNFDRPSPSEVNMPLEALREELNSLDRGLSELLTRRREVTTAINIKLDDTRMHLGSSEEHFAKATGQYSEDKAEAPMDIDRTGQNKDTGRSGW